MLRGNKPQNAPQTRPAGQRLGALIAAAAILLIAITFVGISQASRLGAAGTQLPPAKATLLARDDATSAAARAKNPHPVKPPYSPPVEVPTPTFTSGIYFNFGQAKVPTFNTNDMYRGQVKGMWEFVLCGVRYCEFPDWYRGRASLHVFECRWIPTCRCL